MENPEDRNQFVLSEEIGDTIVAVQEDTDLAVGLKSVDMADLPELRQNLYAIVDSSRHLLGGLGAIQGYVIVDVPKPQLGLFRPPCFAHVRIRWTISSFGIVCPARASWSPLSTMR